MAAPRRGGIVCRASSKRAAVIGGYWAIQALEAEGRGRRSRTGLRPVVPNAVGDHRAVIQQVSLIVHLERDALWLGC